MSIKYHKYDIATKVSLVEEYLKLSKESKIAKSDFAYNKGISDSTFNDLVVKYLLITKMVTKIYQSSHIPSQCL